MGGAALITSSPAYACQQRRQDQWPRQPRFRCTPGGSWRSSAGMRATLQVYANGVMGVGPSKSPNPYSGFLFRCYSLAWFGRTKLEAGWGRPGNRQVEKVTRLIAQNAIADFAQSRPAIHTQARSDGAQLQSASSPVNCLYLPTRYHYFCWPLLQLSSGSIKLRAIPQVVTHTVAAAHPASTSVG